MDDTLKATNVNPAKKDGLCRWNMTTKEQCEMVTMTAKRITRMLGKKMKEMYGVESLL